jgi:hypothetical protein
MTDYSLWAQQKFGYEVNMLIKHEPVIEDYRGNATLLNKIKLPIIDKFSFNTDIFKQKREKNRPPECYFSANSVIENSCLKKPENILEISNDIGIPKKSKSPFWYQFGLNVAMHYEFFSAEYEESEYTLYKYDLKYQLLRTNIDIQTPYINIPYSFSLSNTAGGFKNGKVTRFGINFLPLGIFLQERSKNGIGLIPSMLLNTTSYERNIFQSDYYKRTDNTIFFFISGYRFGESVQIYENIQPNNVKTNKTTYHDIYYLDFLSGFRTLLIGSAFESYKYSIRKGLNKVETENRLGGGSVGLSYFKRSRSEFVKFIGALIPVPYLNIANINHTNTYYDINDNILNKEDHSSLLIEYGLLYYRLIPLHKIRTFIVPSCYYNVGLGKEFSAQIGIITII